MVQWVKALDAKLDDLTSIPRTTWWKEKADSHNCPLISTYGLGHYIHTQNKPNVIIIKTIPV